MCLCNCSKSAKKKTRAPFTNKETANAYRRCLTAHAYRSVVRVSTAENRLF